MTSIIDLTRRLEISTEPWQVRRLAGFYEPPSDEHPYGNGRLYLPKHQRLWSWKNKRGMQKQRELIDSILHNYPIPTIILNALDDGTRERWEIYDGRHRVETIWRFVNSKFSIKIDGVEIFYPDLCPADKARFNDRTIPVGVTTAASPAQLAEVFIRLNSGKALSQADYCHACRDAPLIASTIEILEANRERFRSLFGGEDITKRALMPDWVGVVLGLSTGIGGNMTTSFERIQTYLEEEIDTEAVTAGMNALFDLYTRAAAVTASSTKELKRYVKIGFINAFFLAAWMESADKEKVITDWVRVISHIRKTGLTSLISVSGAQNLTDVKILAVHEKIRVWLANGTMVMDTDSVSYDSDGD